MTTHASSHEDLELTPIQIALAISISLHLLALLLISPTVYPTDIPGADNFVPIDLSKLDTISMSEHGAFSMEGLTAEAQEANQIARAKRKAYHTYLDQVADAIHRHRLDTGHTNLIGLTLYSFDINASSRFENIVLRRSSGNIQLDQTARQAIMAASGEIKRPKILGNKTLTIFQEVRFQYDLK